MKGNPMTWIDILCIRKQPHSGRWIVRKPEYQQANNAMLQSMTLGVASCNESISKQSNWNLLVSNNESRRNKHRESERPTQCSPSETLKASSQASQAAQISVFLAWKV